MTIKPVSPAVAHMQAEPQTVTTSAEQLARAILQAIWDRPNRGYFVFGALDDLGPRTALSIGDEMAHADLRDVGLDGRDDLIDICAEALANVRLHSAQS